MDKTILVVTVIVMLLALACNLTGPTAQPQPPADMSQAPIVREDPVRPVLSTRKLWVLIKPKEAATFLLNPSPIGMGDYPQGMVVTIDVLPNQGWKVHKWAGPAFKIDGTTAHIKMDTSQSVAVQLVLEDVVSGAQISESPAVPESQRRIFLDTHPPPTVGSRPR